MKTNVRLLKVDLVIQKILGGIYLACGLMGMAIHPLLFIAMILQLIIGIWQVLSAIILVITTSSRERIYYLLSVVMLFATTAAFVFLNDAGILPDSVLLAILGLIIVPVSLGIWYLNITQRHYDALINAPLSESKLNTPDMESILDSDELFKSNKL